MNCTNFLNLSSGQLRIVMFFPDCPRLFVPDSEKDATFSHGVVSIIFIGAGEKMIRVATRGIVTAVQSVQLIQRSTAVIFKSETVNPVCFPTSAQ